MGHILAICTWPKRRRATSAILFCEAHIKIVSPFVNMDGVELIRL